MRIKALLLITLLGAFFRFYQLGKIPQSLNWDEIAIGYNAYSILKTGKDEYGEFLPLTFRSFEDYKSPLYIYLTLPSIAFFGKSEFSIRFISALIGTLTIPLTYFLTLFMLRNTKDSDSNSAFWINRIKNIGIIASFILAITPWHVHFSRVAFEANLALFLVILGSVILDAWIRSTKIYLLAISAIIFSLAIYSYANMRLIVPLFLLPIFFVHYQKFIQQKIQTILVTLFALILLIPIFIQMFQGTGLARYQATSLLYRDSIYEQQKQRASQALIEDKRLIAHTFFNYRIPLLREILLSYLNHFDFDFLFVQSEPSRFTMPGVGLLYIWYIPLIMLGGIALARFSSQINSIFTFWWLIVAPVPSALTWDTPHAIRSQVLTLPIIILCALGLWVVFKWIQQLDIQNYQTPTLTTKIIPKLILLALMIIIPLSILSMWLNYHTHMNSEYAQIWLYGRKEMVEKVISQRDDFSQIVISTSLDWAYLWFLWYANIEPGEYLSKGATKGGGFDFQENQIDNIYFRRFDYTRDSHDTTGVLFVGTPKDFPHELVPTSTIENPQGQKIIYIVRS